MTRGVKTAARIVRLLDRARTDRADDEDASEESAADVAELERHLAVLREGKLPKATRELLQMAAEKLPEQTAQLMAQALGLVRKRGAGSWAATLQRRGRDRWLLVACDALEGSDYGRARKLEKEIKKFRDVTWPVWKNKDEPPADSALLLSALFFAFRLSEGDVPGHWKQLRKVVTRARELPSLGGGCVTTRGA